MNITFRVSGADEVLALARRYERAAATLQQRLTGALQLEGQAALVETRAAWMRVEVSSTRGGGKSSGLRARVAAATQLVRTSGGVRIEVQSRRVDPRYGRTLAHGLDGLGTWRHPVFGDLRVQTTQRGEEVFFKTLRGRRWRASLVRVVGDVAREIRG